MESGWLASRGSNPAPDDLDNAEEDEVGEDLKVLKCMRQVGYRVSN